MIQSSNSVPFLCIHEHNLRTVLTPSIPVIPATTAQRNHQLEWFISDSDLACAAISRRCQREAGPFRGRGNLRNLLFVGELYTNYGYIGITFISSHWNAYRLQARRDQISVEYTVGPESS